MWEACHHSRGVLNILEAIIPQARTAFGDFSVCYLHIYLIFSHDILCTESSSNMGTESLKLKLTRQNSPFYGL